MSTASEVSYSTEFYDLISSGAKNSSSQIVPYVCSLLSPSSVVDVGCGSGLWLKAFEDNGAKKIQGFDGPWIQLDQLSIKPEQFSLMDLTAPSWKEESFDLCVSLEVAEHLPESSAEVFVKFLTSLSSTILFSAAIPRQGGSNHLNEQWQSYWIQKFRNNGFNALDLIRPKFWDDSRVALHYKQNAFIFTKDPEVQERFKEFQVRMADAIHPEHYLPVTNPLNYSIRKFVTLFLPHVIKLKTKRLADKFKAG